MRVRDHRAEKAVSEPQASRKIQKGPLLLVGAVALATLVGAAFLPGQPLDKLFFINSGICAQRPAHSYFFEGSQLPLEARMVGIFCSFSLTLFYLWFIGRGRVLSLPERKYTVVLAALLAPVAVDGLNATAYDMGLFHLYQPQLLLRIITGSLSGVGIAALIQPYFNLVVWGLAYPGSSIRQWKELGFALLIPVGVILATISGWGLFFWPLALLATAGVFTMMVMFNLMIFSILSGKQNWARTPAALAAPLALTFLGTLLELGIFAAVRFSVLGPSML